jgi:uncharacterized lipoprotein YmbA
LTPQPQAEQTTQAPHPGEPPAVCVGPVAFPEYLDRPQIVSRTSGNRLKLAEFERWAEPIGPSFTRVLAENLSALLATERVKTSPWKGDGSIDYRITIAVVRFDGIPGGEVSLIARWGVLGPEGEELVSVRRSSIKAPTQMDGYEGLAAAMSEAVAALSREIASVVGGL